MGSTWAPAPGCPSPGSSWIESTLFSLVPVFGHTAAMGVSRRRSRRRSLRNKIFNYLCSGRNNTDLVGVTWPRAGAQKSRVGQEQYPRIAGQIAIWASGGSESGSERPPAAPRSIVVRETLTSAP
ncbi:hypothetical protein Tsp_09945 [Trichinella spiralis]|uniref:hypothetical protein n=1 Tax=Trichinella spiralis TaxID=6334 RepID=UPI0001EFE013|nr:hypothetical protein Tsp_09945 [Trichinella spiralis]